MRTFLLSLFTLVLALTTFSSCYQQPPVSDVYYQPQAQMGYDGNQAVVYVTDNRGEQFLIDYLLYQQLFNAGGYNRVVSYYYSHPSDTHFHVYNRTHFHVSHSLDAQSINRGFSANYNNVRANHRTYSPAPSVVRSSIASRQRTYGSAYQPSSAKPVSTRTYGSTTTTQPIRSQATSTRTYASTSTPSSSSSRSSGFNLFKSSSSSHTSSRSFGSSSHSSSSSYHSSSSRSFGSSHSSSSHSHHR